MSLSIGEQENVTYTLPTQFGRTKDHDILLEGIQDVYCRAENWTQIFRVQDCHTAKAPDGSLLLL